jgi:hypothetical protein
MRSPGMVERAAIALLAEVGGDREWWLWNPRARIGHLRVALTEAENDELPAFCGQVAYGAGSPACSSPSSRA